VQVASRDAKRVRGFYVVAGEAGPGVSCPVLFWLPTLQKSKGKSRANTASTTAQVRDPSGAFVISLDPWNYVVLDGRGCVFGMQLVERPVRPDTLEDLDVVVARLVKQQQADGGFRVFNSVEELCRACGVLDKDYITESTDYDQIVHDLITKLLAALEGMGIQLPEPSAPPTSSRQQLSPEEIRSRVDLVRDRYRAANLMSAVELGALLIATHVSMEGFPVHGRWGGWIRPLLATSGKALADSMVFAVIYHLLLPAGSTIRVDASLLPGHYEAWTRADGLKGLRSGEADVCVRTARLVAGGSFRDITSGGGAAKAAVEQAGSRQARHRHVLHPVNMCMKQSGHLGTIVAIGRSYEAVARDLGSVLVPVVGGGPLVLFLQGLAEGLAKAGRAGQFDSVAATKAARAQEKDSGIRMPWSEIPPLVRFTLTSRTGCRSAEEFDALEFRPQLGSTKPPFSELCWYRSIHGIDGGLASGTDPDSDDAFLLSSNGPNRVSLLLAVVTNREQNALWRHYQYEEPDLGEDLAARYGYNGLKDLLDKAGEFPPEDWEDAELVRTLWAGRQQDFSRMGGYSWR
jgi:hypothetical protein